MTGTQIAENLSTDIRLSSNVGWYLDERFWVSVRPAMFSGSRLDLTKQHSLELIRLLDLQPGQRVLDACCGFGRFSLEFAKHGCKVTAVDACPAFLQELRANAAERSCPITPINSDIRSMDLEGMHDAAALLFTSIGYFENREDDLIALERIRAGLKPKGRIVCDMYSVRHVAETLVDVCERPQFLSIKKRTIDPHSSTDDFLWINVSWTVLSEHARKDFSFGQRIYSASGLEKLFLDAGFGNFRIMADYAGTPFEPSCPTLVIYAEKQ